MNNIIKADQRKKKLISYIKHLNRFINLHNTFSKINLLHFIYYVYIILSKLKEKRRREQIK